MSRIFSPAQLERILPKRRKVVFTSGAFDLFHIGHLSLLRHSALLGGTLIVGVESDENISAYKKKPKPVFSFRQRLQIISQLECVDFVVPLDYGSSKDIDGFYWRIYRMLSPNVVAFGSNFSFFVEVERKCKAIGAELRKISHDYNDVSTSGYLDWITDVYGTGRLSGHYLRNLLNK